MFRLDKYIYQLKREWDKGSLYQFYLPYGDRFVETWLPNKYVKEGTIPDWLTKKNSVLQSIEQDYKKWYMKNPDTKPNNPFEFNSLDETLGGYYHVGLDNSDNNKMEIGVALEENVEPDDVKLDTFKNHKGLNPKIFDEKDKLHTDVRKQILKIADDFYEFLETPWLKVEDIYFTGSLANYNWSKFSDVDIHILVDTSKFKDTLKITEEYFKMKKKLWGEQHSELNIFGYEVEIYVQPKTEEAKDDAAVYSVQNDEWVVKPEYKVEPFDKEKVKKKASEIMSQIDEYEEDFKKEDANLKQLEKQAEKTWNKIKSMRKTGLDREGEFAFENIVFKVLRRTNYMEKLLKLRYEIYDKMNSLNESIEIPVEVGDEVLMGKFKNKKIEVKTIDKDSHGMPTINGKQAATFRTVDK